MASNNYKVNFELLGSADGLATALQAAVGELHQTGVALSTDAGQAAHQISGVFAQALERIANESRRVNQRLESDLNNLSQKAGAEALKLVPNRISKKDLSNNLLSGATPAFAEVAKELERTLGTALTPAVLKGFKADDLRNAVRGIYSGLLEDKGRQSLLDKAASELDQLDDYKKRISSYGNDQIAKSLKKDLTGSLDDRGFGEGKLSATGKSVNQIRKDRADVRKLQIQIEKELKAANNSLANVAKQSPEAGRLAHIVNTLKAQKLQVKQSLAGFSDELGNQLRRSPLTRIKEFLQFSLLAGGIYQISSAIRALTSEVFAASAEFQRLKTSFVAILAEPKLAQGGIAENSGLTTGILNSILRESEEIFKRTQLNAIKTVATTKEYVTTLQSALAVGTQIGLTQEQIENLTLNFIRAAGAFGIEQEKVGSSIAQIFSGSVRVTNQLARNLGLATKEQRDLLKEAIKTGTLYEFLTQKTLAFAETGKQAEDNFINVSAALQDIIQVGGSEAISPLFNFINKRLIDIRDVFLGDKASDLFKAPLVTIIEKIQDTLIALLPNFKAFADETASLANGLLNAFTGTSGVGTLKLVFNLLTAILRTINQIIGGAQSTLGPLIRLVPYLLIGKTVIGLINSGLAITANAVGKVGGIVESLATRFKGGGGGIETPFEKLRLGAQGAGLSVATVTTKIQGFIGSLQGTLAVVGGVATAIGAVILVVNLLVNAYEEYSGAAQKAREAENAIRDALYESIEAIKQRIEQSKILTSILELEAAAKAKAKGAENDEAIAKQVNLLRAYFNEEEILQLQSGKISDQLRAKILANQAAISASFKQSTEDIQRLIDTSFDDYTNAQERLRRATQARDALLRSRGGNASPSSLAQAQVEIDAARKSLEKLNLELERGLAALNNPDPKGTLLNGELYEEYRAKGKSVIQEFTLIQEVALASTKTYAEQILTIARLSTRQSNLREEIKKQNQQTVEGAKNVRLYEKQIGTLSTTISTLTGSIIDNVRAGVENREATIAAAKADTERAKTLIAVAKGQIAVNNAQINSLLLLQQAEQQAAGPAGSDFTLARRNRQFNDAIARLQAASAQAQQDITDAENAVTTNRTIIDALTIKDPKEGDKKYKATRDALQDFLTDFNKKLGIIKAIGELVSKTEAEINATNKRIQDSLAEAGAINAQTLGQREREAAEIEFNLTKDSLERQIKFIDAQQEAVKALAKKAEEDAKVRNAQGDKEDQSPDERERDVEALAELAKQRIDLQSKLADETRKFELEVSKTVETEVKKRIELRQKELDQIPAIVDILADAEKELIQQRGKLNLIGAKELAEADIKINAQERKAKAKRLVQELFPLSDKDTKDYLLQTINNFIKLRKEASEAGNIRFVDTLGDVIKLKELLSQDFPTTLEAANEHVKQFRDTAVSLVTALGSNEAFGDFQVEAQKIDVIIRDLIISSAQYGHFLKEGNAEAAEKVKEEGNKLIGELDTKTQELIDKAKASASTDIEFIKSYTELVQALASTAFITPENERKAQLESYKLTKEEQEDLNKLKLIQFDLDQKSLATQIQLLEVENTRLDSLQQVIDTKKELGIISEQEFREAQRAILLEKIANNDASLGLQERKLKTAFASISSTGLENVTEDAKSALFEVASAMQAVTDNGNALQVQLLQIGSAYVDAADGFAKIADAFGQFQDSGIGIRGNLSKLGPVFTAVENLFRQLEKSRLRSQGQDLLSAPQRFADLVKKAGAEFNLSLVDVTKLLEQKSGVFLDSVSKAMDGEQGFVKKVVGAAEAFADKIEKILKPQAPPPPLFVETFEEEGQVDNPDSKFYDPSAAARRQGLAPVVADLPIVDFKDRLKRILELYVVKFSDEFKIKPGQNLTAKNSFFGKISSFVTKNIGVILEAVASLVSGFARGGAGGIISGVGGAVSAVGGLFANSGNAFLKNLPAVGAIFGVVGGIFDVFAAKAKAKAEAFAKTVGEGIDDIKQAFNDGKISLAEAISQINAQLSTARSKLTGGKTGKKGGNAAFAQLEQQAKEAQEELRRQAEATQKEFLEALNLLRKPAELRDIITQINDARKKAEEFLRSFEDQDGLIGATEQAMEFFRLTIGEIRDGIEKSLKDLRQQLKDAAEQFEKSRRDILLQGRIDPRVSEAENKRKQLIDLEREFRERQRDLLSQIATEQTKLDLVNKRAEIEFKIGQYIERSAAALAAAATTLGNVFAGLPGAGGGGAGGYGNYGDFLNSPQVGDLIMNNKIEVNVNGSNASAQDIGVAVADHIRLAGRTQHNRQTTGTGNF